MPHTELRCPGTLHARLDGNLIEVKCKRRSCGVKPGVIVFHQFDLTTGELVRTVRFSDPRKDNPHGTASRTSVRPA